MIERVRRASWWLLNPACLIDKILDQLERLGGLVVVPTEADGRSRVAAPVEARIEQINA